MISKQKTIHNFNLRFFCILLALILLSMIGSITVYADTGTSVEAEHSDGSYTSSGGKWYATYSRSGGYKGQGVLIYLLERDGGGAVAGTVELSVRSNLQDFSLNTIGILRSPTGSPVIHIGQRAVQYQTMVAS